MTDNKLNKLKKRIKALEKENNTLRNNLLQINNTIINSDIAILLGFYSIFLSSSMYFTEELLLYGMSLVIVLLILGTAMWFLHKKQCKLNKSKI